METGRFKYFASTDDHHGDEQSDTWWFFTQAEHCTYELAQGVPIERGLRWHVPPQATITLATGETVPIHDDRLLSAALLAEADRLAKAGDIFLGSSESAVIQRKTPEDKAW